LGFSFVVKTIILHGWIALFLSFYSTDEFFTPTPKYNRLPFILPREIFAAGVTLYLKICPPPAEQGVYFVCDTKKAAMPRSCVQHGRCLFPVFVPILLFA
jgi:hypothetical protein